MAVIPLMIGIYMLFVDLKSAIVLGVTFVILICFMILLGWAAQKMRMPNGNRMKN